MNTSQENNPKDVVRGDKKRTTFCIKKSDAYVWTAALILIGICIGQLWAAAQQQRRDYLCVEYGLYCPEIQISEQVKRSNSR